MFSPQALPRRMALALLMSTAALITACGGSGGDDKGGDPQLRVLNLSDVASLDVYLGTEKKVSAAGQGTLTTSQGVGAAEYTVELRRAGGDIALSSATRTLSKDAHYTLLAYGRENALSFVTLPEDEKADSLASGKGALRVFNASQDVGDLDVYLTTPTADLSETVATQSGVPSGRLSSYRELSTGSYRLRITGANDSTDLRLDLPAISIKDKTYTTLVITTGPGGVLVHSGSLDQQAGYTALRNTKARLRVVASAAGRGVVTTSWRGQSISAGLVSPSVGPYALIDAGSGAMDIRVAGSTVSNAERTLTAGADYTLLVHGNGDTNLINDDNRLPTAGTARARMRLIHGAPTTDPLTLSVDYAVTAADVARGNASSFISIASGTGRRLDVTAATAADALYTSESTTIQAGAVYTVFVLGGQTNPTGLLRKDR